ncbi:hypothetical protein BZA05DRAFT_389421 [Tricharina praecox]|uniref:uncharacterized protein n=1 Tax=Tricharina praecox TaxID=43433 RepID=UPI002220F9E6|nr:uncharacterized protein BZA05DRAFT_389421 [Tricharina praecox]KAI5855707.1 hypothetical protein BZA05DRAFT_389421 [Tricharina praecox]
MDVYYYFNYMSAGWMVLEAIPLIFSPTVIITLLSPDVRESTALEEYLSRSLGITLIAFAILNLLLTGSVPLTSALSEPAAHGTSTELADPTAPYAVPSLTITLTYHCAVAFYCYTMYTAGHAFTYIIAVVAHALFAAVGGWVMLFGASNGHISRKTGADKRTSGFPFKNVEADKKNAMKKL